MYFFVASFIYRFICLSISLSGCRGVPALLLCLFLVPSLGPSLGPGLVPHVLAQSVAPSEKYLATAVRTSEKITIDGRLDETAWQTATSVSGFTQKDPDDGLPATEFTEVWFLYDDEFLYVSAYCHDRSPGGIVLNELQRDFNLQVQDYFAILIDTFDDDRNGYFFTASPLGNQRDTQFFQEGRDNNLNWDGVWHSAGHFVEDGYTMEMAIPFRTLRFKRLREQIWGLQLSRRIRRRNEVGFWAPIPRAVTATRGISLAGELRGIQDVEPGRNFQAKPYLLGGANHFASRGEGVKADLDAGVDFKYGITSGLSLDLTLNTDFSQVEADTEQVNLTRFPLFFEEKREFFLENAGIFRFGAIQSSEALLFHSRTIGLDNGRPVPILGGARLTGRAGDYYLGFLNMQTRSHLDAPATNFTATTVRRNILGRSDVGVMFLNRQSGQPDDRNRTFGADTNLILLGTDLRLSGALARTETPGLDGSDTLGKVEMNYNKDIFELTSSYVDIGENFNPELGFVSRAGREIFRNQVEFRPRLRSGTRVGRFVRDFVFNTFSNYVRFPGAGPETKYMLSQFFVRFQDGGILGTHYETNFERLTEPFEVSRGVILPVADYTFNENKLWYFSDQSKAVSGNIEYLWADFYSGKRTEITLTARFRPNYHLSTSLFYEHNDIDLPEGAFTTDLVGLRFDYSFNTRMFLNSFLQYNSESDTFLSNIRFRFIHRPLSDIYLVYNDLRDRLSGRNDWSFAVKYTRLIQF